MNALPTTVMLDAEQTPPGLVELLRRTVNSLCQLLSGLAENGLIALATIAIATVTSQVKTTTTATFKVGGKMFTKAATDNFWTLAGAVVAVSSFQKYLLCINAAGVASVIECTQALTAAGVLLPAYTSISGVAVVGTVQIATDATHTFTPGVTLLGAAGITATLSDGFDTAVVQPYGLIKGLTPVGQG